MAKLPPYQLILTFLLGLLFVILLSQKINLTTADLGRHLKNGEITFTTRNIPSTNLYSYTHPDFPFINHHWGSGVIFYLVYKIGGFIALSAFFSLISLATFAILFYFTAKYSSFEIAFLTSIILIPTIISRSEIRPEAFSYLLTAIFFLILWNYTYAKSSAKNLYILPLLTFLWVNLHIYFAFGLFLIGIFLAQTLIDAVRVRNKTNWTKAASLTVILLVSSLTTLLNPFGLQGALYPSKIFSNYGYKLLENQSILFLDSIINYPPNLNFKISFVVIAISFAVSIYYSFKNRYLPNLAIISIGVIISIIGWIAVRNFTLFGYLALPIIAINMKNTRLTEFLKTQLPTLSVLILISSVFVNPGFWQTHSNFGFGLDTNNDKSARFFINENLKGPVFNNYDIGGYLIFYLYPKDKVFVDNRPEAYPTTFFEQTYIPMQESDDKWQEVNSLYNFNTIFFYWHDLTPWAQTFLKRRLEDPEWVPVFVDNWGLIFIRRNEANKDTITKYEVPKDRFKTAN